MPKTKVKIMASAPGYDLAALGYDKKEGYLNSFEQGQVLPMLGDLVGKKVLDIGAGTGRLAIELARLGAEVTALDVSPSMLRVLDQKARKAGVKINTVVGDAESLDFPNNSFDWVVSAFVIVHMKDPKYFFIEAYRVLKDGGKLLATNINQKEPPDVKTPDGIIKIESYYHRPEKIKEELEELAFGIDSERMIKEKEVWINQIIVAKK